MPSPFSKAVAEAIRTRGPAQLQQDWKTNSMTILYQWARGAKPDHETVREAATHERVSVDDFLAGRFGPKYEVERQQRLDEQQRLRTVNEIVRDASETVDPDLKQRKLDQASEVQAGKAKLGKWGNAVLTTDHGVVSLNAEATLAALLGPDTWDIHHRVYPTPKDKKTPRG